MGEAIEKQQVNKGVLKNKIFLYLTEFFAGILLVLSIVYFVSVHSVYMKQDGLTGMYYDFSLPQSVPVTTYDGRAFLNSSDNKDIINVLSANTAALNNRELKNMMARVVSNIDQYDKGNYVLTDDKAPVELLGMQVIDELIKDEVSYYKDIYKRDGIKGLLNSF